jgi:hypothetical protein
MEAIMKDLAFRLALAAVAAAGPTAFPLAQLGYAPLARLAFLMILPSAAVLIIAAAMPSGRSLRRGLIAGALATFALEVIRYTGFRLGLCGLDFGWRFAATVLTAYAAYGAALGWLLDYGASRSRARSSGLSTSNQDGPSATLRPQCRAARTVSSKVEAVDQ